ncbi:MAG: restriction endonuclease [Alphaproteobacteria bacterium]|nr:MAG: restriction endonuclease [Alphaproteobacteria bacterium]
MSAWLERVANVDRETFLSLAFQQELWENESISATGQGHIDVTRVLADPRIAVELWDLKQSELPDDPKARREALDAAWESIVVRVRPLTKRWPRLKMYRVFASLWPAYFTTIAHYHKLRRLARAMGVERGVEHRTELHQRVLSRLDEVGMKFRSQEERMTLPWLLYIHYVNDESGDATEIVGDRPGETRLNPLPANRRRRGMTGIGGGLASVLGMLEFAKEGCKREDFIAHLHAQNPTHTRATLNTNLNCLMAEWGAVRAEGDELRLTDRGVALLETGDPEEVSDWMLTRILGFDNLLVMLRDGEKPLTQVIDELQRVNPGWTTNFAPTVLINWTRYLGLVEPAPGRHIKLTESGEEWAARILWTPEMLAPVPTLALAKTAPVVAGGGSLLSSLPSVEAIMSKFPKGIAFSRELVGRLHAGLWLNQRRHFAVLTGLSGAGKTQLARCYAEGLRDNDGAAGAFQIIPVQPGWHDPSSLLGYINPIQNDVYVRTAFLDFLLQAHGDPDRAYTVVLDEMNLSHPEQYLAPLLSAMETGDPIELHAQGDEVGGVPDCIPYPENLLLIGTVNMDETTHGLSDKVLDRASVIEFWDIDVDLYPGWESNHLDDDIAKKTRDLLRDLVQHLRPVRLHFGWRTIGDVIGYIEAAVNSGVFGANDALDHAVYSKVLPKLRGEDSKRLREAFDAVTKTLQDYALHHSAGKAVELRDDLHQLGSARFWR